MGCITSHDHDDLGYSDRDMNDDALYSGDNDEQTVVDGQNDDDDMFKSYAEIAETEQKRRATQVDEATDIFSRMDIKLLPNVEGNFGRVDNEESGEYIITNWTRQADESLFIPMVLINLMVTYLDMVYRSRWSTTCKGPDFKLNILDKCKATIIGKYTMKQAIRASNCCLRGKVSVFYVTIKETKAIKQNETWNFLNFVGIVSENEDAFNVALPKEGYGGFLPLNHKIKCVVDLRDDHYCIRVIGKQNAEKKMKIPNEYHNEMYKDMKWYPYISGYFVDMECIIEFDDWSTIKTAIQ